MYRPNFCVECGARIVRTRWRLWTSRRFCDACARRTLRARLLWPSLAFAAIFLTGLVAGRAMRPHAPPLDIERAEANTLSALSKDAPRTQTQGGTALAQTAQTNDASSASETAYGPDGTTNERPTDPNETVSICGARTKKGTPCSRRVRGTGRCWQHKGMPAIIPLEKRVSSNTS